MYYFLAFSPYYFLQNNTADLDFEYFVRLFEEYYLSDNPSDLGNFINGRLEFETEEQGADSGSEEEDPGLVDHQAYSSTSLHSMDDDLHPEMENGSHHNHHQKKVEDGSPSPFKRLCDSMKSCWVV